MAITNLFSSLANLFSPAQTAATSAPDEATLAAVNDLLTKHGSKTVMDAVAVAAIKSKHGFNDLLDLRHTIAKTEPKNISTMVASAMKAVAVSPDEAMNVIQEIETAGNSTLSPFNGGVTRPTQKASQPTR